jgi:hypothetical protein
MAEMKIRKVLTLAAVAGVALAGPIVLGAAPAFAAAHCTNITYDPSNGYATANCAGDGEMRFVVRCNAIWPFPAWTKYSQWISSPSDAIHVFPSCDAPYTVSAQY